MKLFIQTFEGHKGRKGLVGGSLPRGSSISSDMVSGNNKPMKEKISKMVDRIPEEELKGISKIVANKSVGPKYDFGTLSGTFIPATGEVNVFSNSTDPESTVAHEIGHNVYQQLLEYNSKNFYERAKAKEEWDKICKKRYKKSRFITWYDSYNENPNETFAEMYKEYNAHSGRDKSKLRDFLLSDGQDDTDLEKPFFDILHKVGSK